MDRGAGAQGTEGTRRGQSTRGQRDRAAQGQGTTGTVPRCTVPEFLPCLPAGDGWVHKALDLGSRIHLVEELQVFEPAQPVESLVLAGTKVSMAGVVVAP